MFNFLKNRKLSLILVLVIPSCTNSPTASYSELKTNIIYQTSFESENELSGWVGIDVSLLINEAPVGCGDQSVMISGGCLIPHAQYTLQSPGYDCSVMARCYGKNLSNGGTLNLDVGETFFSGLHISIEDTLWQKYESSDTLFWPADYSLWLTLNAGGFVGSSMLIDSIQIILIK